MKVDSYQTQQPLTMAAAAGAAPQVDVRSQEMIKAVQAVNESELLGQREELTFFLSRATGQPVIRIVDRETREIIREIPQEAVLRLSSYIDRVG